VRALGDDRLRVRRARPDDVEFLLELALHEDVRPFLGAVAAHDAEAVAAEVARSEREPHDYGRLVIETDGERAGAMGFEIANRRSRIAQLERLAIHPRFRGRRLADAAARMLQRHLIVDLGYHRLQLEIYGFNERAMRHAERAGFVREGVRRRAYWRRGQWVDGVLYGLIEEDIDVPDGIRLLHEHVARFNEGVRGGDFGAMIAGFAEDAEMAFEGIPVGPFRGRDEIAAAYRERPPDDELHVLEADEHGDTVMARYAWARAPNVQAGRMRLRPAGDKISSLAVTFEEE
jgi:RimJ/RimL family protein N-acetyltransferase